MADTPVFPATPPGTIVNLSALRVVAAIAVVYFHITSEAGLNFTQSFGTRGVDIFFVISGFIIAYIGSKNSDKFLLRRLIRIVPFYWAATIGVFAIVLVFPTLLRSTRADFLQLLCSLLFIPRETDYAGLFPTLILGWSLNYEMYFYVLFSISLLAFKRHAPLVCVALIALVFFLISASGTTNPSVLFYARPLVFEFVFGIFAFYLLLYFEGQSQRFQRLAIVKYMLLAVFLAALLVIFLFEYAGGLGLPRAIGAGIPAFFIVTCAILLERVYGVSVSNRLLFQLGESSYILYLIHPYIIFGVLRALIRLDHEPSAFESSIIVVSLIAVSSAIAIAIHLFFERPVMNYLRRVLLRQSSS
jgi:exopolysaccharide production protein ExoZ